MQNWHLALYEKSVVKQLKMSYLRRFIGDASNKRCLDLGSDNGVVSYLLRQSGGNWASADIDDRTVGMIRELVHSEVYTISESRMPFADASFDCVVIVDLLEHLHDDAGCIREISRILKPQGELVVNVPHRTRRSLIRLLRNAIGLTDEQHGHVRAGYTRTELTSLLSGYSVEEEAFYSKFGTEFVDLCVSGTLHLLSKGKQHSRKGTLVGSDAMKKHRKIFTLYTLLYPFMWLCSKCDGLFVLSSGYRLILRARKGSKGAV